jgi:predicted ester cyclase
VLDYLAALTTRTGLRRFLTEDVVFEAPGVWAVRGADAVERAVRHHYEVEFDARPEVVGLAADDRLVAAEVVFAGTHTGEYGGLAATGRKVRVPLAMVFDVDAGLIAGIRVYYSPEQLMAQLRGA